jgi:hypothetical protein
VSRGPYNERKIQYATHRKVVTTKQARLRLHFIIFKDKKFVGEKSMTLQTIAMQPDLYKEG